MLERAQLRRVNHFRKGSAAHWLIAGRLSAILAAAIVLSFVYAAEAEEQKTIFIQPAELKGDQVIKVDYDPVYELEKRYRGMPLTNYLKNQGIDVGRLPGNTLVVFHCPDGYKPVTTLSQIVQDNAFLATADEEAPSGRHWIPFLSHGAEHEPGPLYLVWPHTAKGDSSHPWPYGIESFSVGNSNDLFRPADPQSDDLRPGFLLFRQYCITCHSMNGVGGTLAIELNLPRNVFEYWQKDMLLPYVANPESFRRNAKMPSFEHLGTAALSQILRYVQYMGKHKAADSTSRK